MNDRLTHFQLLPRRDLQTQIRNFTEDRDFYLWEYIGLNWIYTPVKAGKQTALFFGVQEGSVIGYHVTEGHVMGSGISDLENVSRQAAPYPDPFKHN